MGEIRGLEDKNGNLELKTNISTGKVCRTCLNLVESSSSILVRSLDNDNIADMVSLCLPQLNLQLTNEPVMCPKCFSKLEDFYNFLRSCFDVENKLLDYLSTHQLTTPFNLYDLIQIDNKTESSDYVKLENEESIDDSTHVDLYNRDSNDECESMAFNEQSDTCNEEIKETKKRVLRKKSKTKSEESKSLFSEDLVEVSVKCETCNRKFPSKWALDRHLPVHKEDHKFKCASCDMAFRYKHSFEKHLQAHLNGAPISKPFACDCGKFFNRRAKLKKHQLIHVKKDKPFGCEDCGKRFVDQESLNSHVFRIHTSEKAFSCEICGNKYSSKSGLDVHFKTHFPSDKPDPKPDLMCDFCGKLFYRKYSLEKHCMSHTGYKPHECEQCGMRFKERYQLTIHNRRHTGEKPFDCEVCGFKFPSKNRLVVHMRIHTGVRPFPCNMCDMAFTRKDHLIKHMRAIHTGERPFECDICMKTFNRRDYLIKHKKVHVKRGS